jgi:hypothetical protein
VNVRGSLLPPRRQCPLSGLGDPHPRRLDGPVLVFEAFVSSDYQAALDQINQDVRGNVGSEERFGAAVGIVTRL